MNLMGAPAYKAGSQTADNRNPMTVEAHYKSLLNRSSHAFEQLKADQEVMTLFTKAHNFLGDYEAIYNAIATRPEAKVLALASREYQFALYAAATGTYRHATLSLRLFLELALATVQFSAYEIKLRQWLSSSADINWEALINQDTGVFSKTFVRAFSESLDEHGRQYAAIAKNAYRECSEFVHGNFNTHTNLEAPLGYHRETALAWIERAESVRLCVLFAFTARYVEHISQEARDSVESLILETLGELQGVQTSFAAKVKNG